VSHDRLIKYNVTLSLDGYIADRDGNVDWLVEDDTYEWEPFYSSCDTVIMGRETHDFAVAHGMTSYEGMKNYVFSRMRDSDDVGDVEYRSGDVADLVDELREKEGKHIWLIGGASLAAQFFDVSLVDEIIATVQPMVLGSGIRLLDEIPTRTPVRLISSQVYPSGLVQLTYRCRGKA